MKKKIISMALVVAMVAIMLTSFTLAYFQDTAKNTNTMTLGSVDIEQWEYERVLNDDGTYKTGTYDNKTTYFLKGFEQNKPLLPIVGDPNEPADSPAFADWDATTVRMTQVGSYGSAQVFAGKNAQDKFVVVKNTGKSSAYVRTLVAIEVGSGNRNLLMVGDRHGDGNPWIRTELTETVTFGGTTYKVYEYVYCGASDVNRHVNGVLPANDTTYPSLCQVYLKHNATNEDVVKIDANANGALDIQVLSQAVQADGFENAQTALDTAFGEFNATNVAKWFTAA